MSLFNPYAFTPFGQPAAPAVNALRVMDVPATGAQMAAAQKVFSSFCAQTRLSKVPNQTAIGRLPDGTQYKIAVVGAQTFMQIWPQTREGDAAHSGIGVVTAVSGETNLFLFSYKTKEGVWRYTTPQFYFGADGLWRPPKNEPYYLSFGVTYRSSVFWASSAYKTLPGGPTPKNPSVNRGVVYDTTNNAPETHGNVVYKNKYVRAAQPDVSQGVATVVVNQSVAVAKSDLSQNAKKITLAPIKEITNGETKTLWLGGGNAYGVHPANMSAASVNPTGSTFEWLLLDRREDWQSVMEYRDFRLAERYSATKRLQLSCTDLNLSVLEEPYHFDSSIEGVVQYDTEIIGGGPLYAWPYDEYRNRIPGLEEKYLTGYVYQMKTKTISSIHQHVEGRRTVCVGFSSGGERIELKEQLTIDRYMRDFLLWEDGSNGTGSAGYSPAYYIPSNVHHADVNPPPVDYPLHYLFSDYGSLPSETPIYYRALDSGKYLEHNVKCTLQTPWGGIETYSERGRNGTKHITEQGISSLNGEMSVIDRSVSFIDVRLGVIAFSEKILTSSKFSHNNGGVHYDIKQSFVVVCRGAEIYRSAANTVSRTGGKVPFPTSIGAAIKEIPGNKKIIGMEYPMARGYVQSNFITNERKVITINDTTTFDAEIGNKYTMGLMKDIPDIPCNIDEIAHKVYPVRTAIDPQSLGGAIFITQTGGEIIEGFLVSPDGKAVKISEVTPTTIKGSPAKVDAKLTALVSV